MESGHQANAAVLLKGLEKELMNSEYFTLWAQLNFSAS